MVNFLKTKNIIYNELQQQQKRFSIFVLLLASLIAFSFQGSRGLYETSEGRYAECAREMVEKNNFLNPQLDYQPHFTKPPLTYWAIACGLKIFGNNEWGARFYNALAFILTTLAIMALAAAIWNKDIAWLAGIVYATSPFPAFGAFSVTTDTLLALWICVTLLSYVRACRAVEKKSRTLWILAMWFFCGLGFLTKGPALFIFIFPIFAWHFIKKNPFNIFHPAGILIFLLTGCSWYLAQCLQNPQLFSYFIREEVFGRFSSDLGNNHKAPNGQWYKPFTMYVPVLTLGAGPWFVFLIDSIKNKRIFSSISKQNDTYSGEKFILVLFFIPLIVFFIAKSRMYLYVLPLYIFIALAVARGLQQANTAKDIKKILSVAVITAFIFIVVKAFLIYLPSQKNMQPLYQLCCKIKTPQTKFYTFSEYKLYGLQFYLNGSLKRIYDTDKTKDSVGALENFFRQILSDKISRTCIITSQKKSDALLDTLKKNNLSFKTFSTEYWILCQIDPSQNVLKLNDSKDINHPLN